MNKKCFFRLSVLMMILSLMLTSCRSLTKMTDVEAPYACCYFACPVCDVLDFRGYGYSKICTDSYGRIMFTEEFSLWTIDDKIKCTVIMQKYDGHTVYYYEDDAYYLGDISESEMESFKDKNDWGKPLDDSKMTSRYVEMTFDGAISNSPNLSGRDIISMALNIDDSQFLDGFLTDFKSETQAIWLCKVSYDHDEKLFFVIANNDKFDAFETDSTFSNLGELSDYKKQVGWK